MPYDPNDLDNGWYGQLPHKATEVGVRKLISKFFPPIIPPGVVTFEANPTTHLPIDNPLEPTRVIVTGVGARFETDAAFMYNFPSSQYLTYCLTFGLPVDRERLNYLINGWKPGEEDTPAPAPGPPPPNPLGEPMPNVPPFGPNAFQCSMVGYLYPVGSTVVWNGATYIKRRHMFTIYWEKV